MGCRHAGNGELAKLPELVLITRTMLARSAMSIESLWSKCDGKVVIGDKQHLVSQNSLHASIRVRVDAKATDKAFQDVASCNVRMRREQRRSILRSDSTMVIIEPSLDGLDKIITDWLADPHCMTPITHRSLPARETAAQESKRADRPNQTENIPFSTSVKSIVNLSLMAIDAKSWQIHRAVFDPESDDIQDMTSPNRWVSHSDRRHQGQFRNGARIPT